MGNAESILLSASATSDQGGAFIRWTSAFPSTPPTPTSSTTICVPGFSGGGTREYFANCVSQADLSITKSDAPDPVSPGGTLTYTLTVTNGGPTGATSVTVTDTLPAGVTFVSAAGAGWTCSQSSGTVTCTRASLVSRLSAASVSPARSVPVRAACARRFAARQILPVEVMCPAAGQGALAIETRAGDRDVIGLLTFLDDDATRRETDCERALLHAMGGGCQVPIGANANRQGSELRLEAVIASGAPLITNDTVAGDGAL